MGFFDKLRAELIDIVEWIDDSRHTLVWRFPRYHNQIKNGAQLIVRPGQQAIFVHRGELADVFDPGHYSLTTDNLPILSTLAGWKYGFDSPFKAEVYFVTTRQVTDLKWGTPHPVTYRDPDYGPMQVRAFGNYTLRALEPKTLLRELVGTDGEYETDEINDLMRAEINQALQDMLGEAKMSILDLAGNTLEFAEELRQHVCERIDDELGLEVPKLHIVNFSAPEEIEKDLQTRTRMNIIGDMQQYQQFQMGNAMLEAAQNPAGGGATEGMGLGMGFAMANQMVNTMGGAAGQQPAGAVAPPPPQAAWYIAAGGQTQGPFNAQQMVQGVTSGQVSANTPVWRAGMSGWSPAGQVPELAQYFNTSAPPPPPPPAPPTE